MKRIFAILALFLFLPAFLCAQTKGKLTVAPPAAQNMEESGNWLPLFVQGQLTADFQNYSDFTVIDRTTVEQLLGEQRILENASAVNNENVSIQYASVVTADYIVVANLLKKGESYSFDAKILDVKTCQSIGKAYSNANVYAKALDDGSAVHQAAYELLSGLNISDNKLEELKKKCQPSSSKTYSAETLAQSDLAKGIIAEKKGSNIEALTYYIHAKKNNKNLREASKRMTGLSSVVASGNFGAIAKNMIKLRNDWNKLLAEAAQMLAENAPEFRLMYFTNIRAAELTEKNYENNTINLTVGAPYLKQTDNGNENEQLVYNLLKALSEIPESKNWGKKINGFPWSYGADFPSDNWLYKASLGNEFNLAEALEEYEGNFDSVFLSLISRNSGSAIDFYHDSDSPMWIDTSSINPGNCSEKFNFTISIFNDSNKIIAERKVVLKVIFSASFGGYKVVSSENVGEEYGDSYIGVCSTDMIIKDIPVSDADSDNYSLKVTQTGGRRVSIMPVPQGVMSYGECIELSKSGKLPDNGILRIGGFVSKRYKKKNNEREYEFNYNEISSLFNSANVIDFSEAELYIIPDSGFDSLQCEPVLILPNTLEFVAPGAFKQIWDKKVYTNIKFTGTKLQWESINRSQYVNSRQDIEFNYNAKE